MACRRGLFESLQTEIENREEDDSSISSYSDESDGEDFNYEFPHDDELPEPSDSDEEYVLTELGPVAYHFPDNDEENNQVPVPSTSATEPPSPSPSSSTTDAEYTAKDGTIWSKVPPVVQKTPSRNVFKPPKTPLRCCETVITPLSAFKLFLTDSMVADIVKYTNMEGVRAEQDNWRPTDSTEILALVGCFIHLGAKNM
ncbi:PiggyBac transposable element-derived protein 4, partial [Plakobranchus ocellatus]